MAKAQETLLGKAEILEVYRALDHRKLTTNVELTAAAKLYNVKAELWKYWKRHERDPNVYEMVRKRAVNRLIDRGGGTVDELCRELESIIVGPSQNAAYRYSEWKRLSRRMRT